MISLGCIYKTFEVTWRGKSQRDTFCVFVEKRITYECMFMFFDFERFPAS